MKRKPAPIIINLPAKVPDGLFKVGIGKGTKWVFIQDGILYLPTMAVSPIAALTSGKPIMVVGKHTFMRAADMIEVSPEHRDDINTIAARYGASL